MSEEKPTATAQTTPVESSVKPSPFSTSAPPGVGAAANAKAAIVTIRVAASATSQ